LLLVLILVVNFWLAASFLLLAILVWVIGGQVAAYFRREVREGSQQGERAMAHLQESTGLLRLVKCFQMEHFNQNRMERQLAEAGDAEFLPPLTTRIEFRSVSLQEPGTGRMLLENISFAIPAGAKIALVGPDPAEKHALVYLLPRFLDPTSGEIRIEDKNIKWVTHESLRAQVAVVLQDDLVFSDTVLNNIGGGDPGYTLPQIIEAAKLAHAHQFIEKLPYGCEALVGDH